MDTKTNEKVYALFVEDFKRNHVRNDDVDLLPHHELEISMFDSAQPMNFNSQVTKRNLQQLQSTVTIKTLVEPYPTKCQNSGQLANQTQRYYLCSKRNEAGDFFRVDSATYENLIQNYSAQYECKTQNVQKEVCFCA